MDGSWIIEVRFEKPVVGISDSWIKKIIAYTLHVESSKRCFVSVLLTGNRQIRVLNKKFLNHDAATDVISFWAKTQDLKGKQVNYLGDLAVSFEMAKNVARDLKISFQEELARYLIHGTLHLLGYDDQKPKNQEKMFKRQELILKKALIQ